jgi:hypothetical protein
MKRLPTIKQLEDKQPLYEYAVKDITTLKRYLNLSKEDQKKYLSEEYWYTWEYFVDEHDEYDEYEVNDYDEVNDLPDEVKEVWDTWIYDKLDKGDHIDININDEDVPTWVFMDFVELVKNRWLVHLTNDADGIMSKGFLYGVDNMEKLGLTTHMGDADKEMGGYNFAYDIQDVDRYGKSRGRYKYGEEAVFFRASGIKIQHHADEEPQIIFYGNTATDIIPAYQNDGSWELRSIKTNETVVTRNSLGQLGEWLEKNFAQYSKSLIS